MNRTLVYLSCCQAVKRVLNFRRTINNCDLSIFREKGKMGGQITPLSEIAIPRNPGLSIEGGNLLCVEPEESEERK